MNPQNLAAGLTPPTADAASQQGAPPDPAAMMLQIAGNVHGGAVPMHPGGNIHDLYPNIRVMSHVDWRQVNPRLLETLQKIGEKHTFTIVLQNGYRDHRANARHGGHPQSAHKRGLAVDAFVAGHPLGEVVGPDELMKLGLQVGGPNGDTAHVQLAGIPLKQRKGAPDEAPTPEAAPPDPNTAPSPSLPGMAPSLLGGSSSSS